MSEELWLAIINAATPAITAAVKNLVERDGTFPTPEQTLAELHSNSAKYIAVFDQWLRDNPERQ